MKLRELNTLIKEGDYIIYNTDLNAGIVYDNDTKKQYEDYEVVEIYPIVEVVPTVVIEVCKEVV